MEFRQIRTHSAFVSSCVPTASSPSCCRSWSLGNYVALLGNRSSCFDITDADVGYVKTLLQQCAPFYHNRTLLSTCADPELVAEFETCKNVPTACKRYDAVYNILHFLTDINFDR